MATVTPINGTQLHCDGHGWQEILEANPGPTYRQLDFWTRAGYLQPCQHVVRGTGNSRHWPVDQADLASRMHDLTNMGFAPGRAHTRATDPHQLAWTIQHLQNLLKEIGTK